MNINKRIGIFIMIISIFILSSCSYLIPSKPEIYYPDRIVNKSKIEYYTETVSRGFVEKSRKGLGSFKYARSKTINLNTLDLPDWAKNKVKITGKPDILFELGDSIKAGQRVVTINTNIDSIISEIKEKLKDLSFDPQLLEQLSLAEKLKASFTYTAEFNCNVITLTQGKKGEGAILIEVADTSEYYLTYAPKANEFDLFKLKEKGHIIIDAAAIGGDNNYIYSAEVVNVAIQTIDKTQLDAGANLYKFKLTGNFDINIIKQASSATFKIIEGQASDVIAIPISTIKKINNKYLVTVIKDGQKEDREVVVGLYGDDKVEIKSGLSEGELIAYNA